MQPIQPLMHIMSSALRSPRDLPPSGEEGGSQAIKAQQRLRELILTGELAAGARIAELALVDLLGGRITMMFDTVAQQTQNIAAGKVTALAVTGPKRSPLLPDVPTTAEAGMPKLRFSAWLGVLAPAGTSMADCPTPPVQRELLAR